MNDKLPIIYLARHAETAWSLTGQHTGLTDLPLTERGECNARTLGQRLSGLTLAKVFTSPLRRVMRTCELAGFGTVAEIDHDLVEWGLRRVRKSPHSRDSSEPPGRAAISRRLPRRRIAAAGRCAG
jgi:broad specificity phosphatase PhoE